ncbi:hypothetical protein [Nostocoides sp. HKS02]|uniref:hypothetical protein n=1 Tax=Nostocoides sp. HKS02 TaxID=1813880 RepID=UPI0012B4AB21|nr:hypothetical protein [Tetrasphaera sp. HKS02]QGN58916.1 hypothetical protein GKE56_14615 [Tetrasphaera sp. HKS02]
MVHPPVGAESGADVPRESDVGSAIIDKGSFSHAVCRACGWRGPGRRSRRVAGVDASSHVAHCPGRVAVT